MQYLLNRSLIVRSSFPALTFFHLKREINKYLRLYGFDSLDTSYANFLLIEDEISVSDLRLAINQLLAEDPVLPQKYIVLLHPNISTAAWNVFLKVAEEGKVSCVFIVSQDAYILPPIESRCFHLEHTPQLEEVSEFFHETLSPEQYLAMTRFNYYGRASLEKLKTMDILITSSEKITIWALLTSPFLLYYFATKLLLVVNSQLKDAEIKDLRSIVNHLSLRDNRLARTLVFPFLYRLR